MDGLSMFMEEQPTNDRRRQPTSRPVSSSGSGGTTPPSGGMGDYQPRAPTTAAPTSGSTSPTHYQHSRGATLSSDSGSAVLGGRAVRRPPAPPTPSPPASHLRASGGANPSTSGNNNTIGSSSSSTSPSSSTIGTSGNPSNGGGMHSGRYYGGPSPSSSSGESGGIIVNNRGGGGAGGGREEGRHAASPPSGTGEAYARATPAVPSTPSPPRNQSGSVRPTVNAVAGENNSSTSRSSSISRIGGGGHQELRQTSLSATLSQNDPATGGSSGQSSYRGGGTSTTSSTGTPGSNPGITPNSSSTSSNGGRPSTTLVPSAKSSTTSVPSSSSSLAGSGSGGAMNAFGDFGWEDETSNQRKVPTSRIDRQREEIAAKHKLDPHTPTSSKKSPSNSSSGQFPLNPTPGGPGGGGGSNKGPTDNLVLNSTDTAAILNNSTSRKTEQSSTSGSSGNAAGGSQGRANGAAGKGGGGNAGKDGGSVNVAPPTIGTTIMGDDGVEYEMMGFGDVIFKVPKRRIIQDLPAPVITSPISLLPSSAAAGSEQQQQNNQKQKPQPPQHDSAGGSFMGSMFGGSPQTALSSGGGSHVGDDELVLSMSGSGMSSSGRRRASLVQALVDELDSPMEIKEGTMNPHQQQQQQKGGGGDQAGGGTMGTTSGRRKSAVSVESLMLDDEPEERRGAIAVGLITGGGASSFKGVGTGGTGGTTAGGSTLKISSANQTKKPDPPVSFGDFEFGGESEERNVRRVAPNRAGPATEKPPPRPTQSRNAVPPPSSSDDGFTFGDLGNVFTGSLQKPPSTSTSQQQRQPSASTLSQRPGGGSATAEKDDTASLSTTSLSLAKTGQGKRFWIKNFNVTSTIGHPGKVRGLVSCDTQDMLLVSAAGDELAASGHRRGVETLHDQKFAAHGDIVLHISVSIDGRFVATAGNDGTLFVHDTHTAKRVAMMRHPGPVTCSAFAENGRFVVSGCHDGACRLFSTKGEGPLRVASVHGDASVETVALQPHGECAASGGSDGTLKLWRSASGLTCPLDVTSAKNRRTLLHVVFANKGQWLLSLDPTMLVVTDVKSGTALSKIESKSVACDVHRLRKKNGVTGRYMFAACTLLAFNPHTGWGGVAAKATPPKPSQDGGEKDGSTDGSSKGGNGSQDGFGMDDLVVLAGNDKVVRVMKLNVASGNNTRSQSPSSLTQALGGGGISKPMSPPKPLITSPGGDLVTSLPPREILSFSTKGIPCVMNSGKGNCLLVGDTSGNVYMVHLEHMKK